ncbi:MAG: hypothetical protein JWO64_2510 [Hyphomicrobiales bacterium]|jgi:hypothetical protein|nr:hypothetical protein [Hyphomicrobiales bacterium]
MCAPKDRVMFFLIRCIFWLGIVFMALPWDSAGLRADISGQAEQAARALAAQAQAICVKDPIACAAQAISLGKGAAHSQHNLQPGDFVPAWRGPATVTARR